MPRGLPSVGVLSCLWLLGGSASIRGEAALPVSTVIYVNRYFEVREHDAPTKYVWNGETRVARVTGSLFPIPRVQRLRVWSGWNLCSLAVTASNAVTQLSTLAPQIIEAAFKWTHATTNWTLVAANDSLPAGTVLWLNATTNATLGVTGAYPDHVPSLRAPPEGAFLPGAGLEVFPTTNLSPTVTAAAFDTPGRAWNSSYPAPLQVTNLKSVLAPGQGFYAKAPVPTELLLPDPALSLRFYHQDHLCSTSCLTDAKGNLAEETANYPFGHPRQQHQPNGLHEAYQFSQKEQDMESANYYFEARFCVTVLGRFASSDYLMTGVVRPSVNPQWASQPVRRAEAGSQQLNPYSYALNSPISRADPSGLETVVIVTFDKTLGVEYGSHTAVHIDNGAEPMLFDPRGTYLLGSGRGLSGVLLDAHASIDKYVEYQESTGSTVKLFPIETTPEQEKQIANRIYPMGGKGIGEDGGLTGLTCAQHVSEAISGIGPFKQISDDYTFPGSLAKDVSKLVKPSSTQSTPQWNVEQHANEPLIYR